jgi:hypothetical protein
MNLLHPSLLREEQVRANWIVGEIAGLLPCPTAEECLPELSEVPVLGAEYFGWQLHVYLDLVEEEFDGPLGFWVLILSRRSERAFRVFEGDDFYQAALHVRRFVRDEAYRRRWLSAPTHGRKPDVPLLPAAPVC